MLTWYGILNIGTDDSFKNSKQTRIWGEIMKKYNTDFRTFFNTDVDTVIDMFLNGKEENTYVKSVDIYMLLELLAEN